MVKLNEINFVSIDGVQVTGRITFSTINAYLVVVD